MKTLLEQMKEAVRNGQTSTLTLEKAKKLQGKKIRTIYFGYMGQDHADEFYIGEIISEYDLAAKEDFLHINKRFKNRAEYWESYMTPKQLWEVKNKLNIITTDGRNTYIKTYINGVYGGYDEGIFWCSDLDRFVEFIEV